MVYRYTPLPGFISHATRPGQETGSIPCTLSGWCTDHGGWWHRAVLAVSAAYPWCWEFDLDLLQRWNGAMRATRDDGRYGKPGGASHLVNGLYLPPSIFPSYIWNNYNILHNIYIYVIYIDIWYIYIYMGHKPFTRMHIQVHNYWPSGHGSSATLETFPSPCMVKPGLTYTVGKSSWFMRGFTLGTWWVCCHCLVVSPIN